jgi:radical SAM enzyme (TIGR01210 family)
MNEQTGPEITDDWILSLRGSKNRVEPSRPYAILSEKERTRNGATETSVVIFITNRECPFHCLMCDLWKNTTSYPVPAGVIPHQLEWALGRLPSAKTAKLYNSGSFFDQRAVPLRDYERIASLLNDFDTVVVESHPAFINSRSIEFRNMLRPELEIALGLETVHNEVLRKLNKQMSPDDFRNSVRFLTGNGISTRAFILLRPPYMTEDEGIYWAERSIEYAFESGVECCTVIPVRGGNGALEKLSDMGFFTPPDIRSLESVLEFGIRLGKGRVFADTWDLKLFPGCVKCAEARISRITQMNLSQVILPEVECNCSRK